MWLHSLCYYKTGIQVCAGMNSHLEALGKSPFQVHSYCWQNLVLSGS